MDHSRPPTMGEPSNPSYTVLRIKRKATEAPLSSLVINGERKISTKRRRDVSGRPRGVFRLAETVPDTWQGKGEEGEVLKTRIQGLISSSSQPDSPVSLPRSPLASQQKPVDPIITKQDNADETHSQRPPDITSDRRRSSTQPTSQGQTQYRVIPPMSPRTRSMLPPRIVTIAETENQSPLVFVDAQAVPSSSKSMAKIGNAEDEKEMATFLPMLEEYLKLEEASKTPESISTPAEDEWVYDLYYRDNTSVPLGLGAGDGVTIGELLGFEDISPPSSISGSEPEDEADEDSNDEDYYRNDYPEDEDADEDMEGFRGGGGESDWSDEFEDEGQDDEDRGEWGYR
ncbi:uncharacterized protein I303_105516 [Kwoniella dejecticola CBS 10117]|uniref:Probable RNA polymerase II nuclear localization protein SLC7A6OS n=1 Tax=Kwoniella dejecticola CBS 10117 TaxID=1296121 RepID=A0A1A6A297_9TREE|nr:uncharacterized protein I303_05042 [Kwoniella dejecticola CBS 10117]OBR84185.1 hypothetical protein I303_05042 [Kwoniella dejecticola CBS 10117]